MPLSNVRWWNRLAVILPAGIALGTLLLVGSAAVLFLQAQERHLLNEVQRGAALFSETIKSSTYHDMLEDRRESAYLVMDTIGRQAGIDRVRFFNKEGRVTFSSDRTETNTMVDKRAEQCYGCHEAGRPLERLTTSTRNRTYSSRGHRVLGMVTPIYNEAACSTAACHAHPPEKRVLGVIDIGISLAEIDAHFAAIRRNTMLAAGLSVLVLGALVGFIAQRAVVHPVVELVAATRAVAAGDFTREISVATTSELGALERSFNEMIGALSKARAQRQALLETLEQQVEDRTAALKDAQAQLVQSEKLSSLGRLAASIAHEINNPLAGILTYAKLLIRMLESDPVDEPTRATSVKHLRLVQRETERCTAIVRNLLDFARQRPLSLKDTDVVAVLEEAVSLVGHQAALKGLTISKTVKPVPLVKADAGQLRQAIVNIILNGFEAMQSGGSLKVRCGTAAGGKQIEFACEDSGVGIPPDRLAKIFDPFFSTKEMGTGLGLSVVYGIVERHGGTIDVRSEVGKGTTVVLRLPITCKAEA
ncbi:MAG: ATP-binding protein [Vicinamibacterales bacterium]|jgi:two-component system NtrC family sensor kinase|nr:ATP-binding protein [Vicinamibacterales bacterium]